MENNLKNQLNRMMSNIIRELMQKIDYLEKRLISPHQQIQRQKEQIHQYLQRINQSIKNKLVQYQLHIEKSKLNLIHLNPNAVLSRGYSIIYNEDQKKIISSIKEIDVGDKINVLFSEGFAEAAVTKTKTR